MPIRNAWLPREGLTADVVGRLINNTVLNPALTLPLLLLAGYTQKGQSLKLAHLTIYKRLRWCFWLALIRWVSGYLSRRSLNNWQDDRYDWSQEIVIVTGGSDGIGAHVVRLLAERKIKVIVLDIQPLTFEAPSHVTYYKCDITSPSAIATTASKIRASTGAPTILINNAGTCHGKTILSATPPDIQQTFSLNTLAHYWLAQEFLPDMIKANHGMVVTIASMAAFVTTPQLVDYSASKAAALAFHEGLSGELVTRYDAPKVRTVVVTPGYTKTKLFAGWRNDDTFLIPSLHLETLAEEIVKQVLRGESGYVVVPKAANLFVVPLRAVPYWWQVRVRKDLTKAMVGWKGRQVG
ncbi:MAG: hypothetical protein M1827_004889 [Pycnora praestabilis]|nr:MAG: hypothetical protein M1827_004889 [Pycnora praestabilis]